MTQRHAALALEEGVAADDVVARLHRDDLHFAAAAVEVVVLDDDERRRVRRERIAGADRLRAVRAVDGPRPEVVVVDPVVLAVRAVENGGHGDPLVVFAHHRIVVKAVVVAVELHPVALRLTALWIEPIDHALRDAASRRMAGTLPVFDHRTRRRAAVAEPQSRNDDSRTGDAQIRAPLDDDLAGGPGPDDDRMLGIARSLQRQTDIAVDAVGNDERIARRGLADRRGDFLGRRGQLRGVQLSARGAQQGQSCRPDERMVVSHNPIFHNDCHVTPALSRVGIVRVGFSAAGSWAPGVFASGRCAPVMSVATYPKPDTLS